MSGYYRLTFENPQGCLACECHLNGTVDQKSDCQDDYNGQCSCKPNVALRNCSQCKDGYYDLQNSDPNGCKFCDCDVGGTKTNQSCDKTTGVCDCHPHVAGRTCNEVESGFYHPDAHFINAAKSPYKPATHTLNLVLDIPKTGKLNLLVNYTNTAGQEVEVQTVLQFKNVHIRSSGPQEVEYFNFSQSLVECPVGCPLTKLMTGYPRDYLLLKKGLWLINITATQPIQGLQLNRVIAIPEELQEPTVLGEEMSNFQLLCNVESNDMSVLSCLGWLFTITMNYLQGALACGCHPLGSNSSECESYGGQCHCKPGVEGRDCGRCKPGFYNLTQSGCTPCRCNGPNKICDPTTGTCECPENTIGRTCLPCQCNNNTNKCLRTEECIECQFNTTGFSCQHCAQGHFGNAVNQQCNACSCNEDGSVDQECNRVTGQCNCKKNVTGRNCSMCKRNTFDFGPHGCRDCKCNPYGSANMDCSPSGQCSCLANVTGMKCTQCPLGFYGLPMMACRECNCSEIGAVNGTACVNDNVGQCHCKRGVTGRACDRCMKYFTNFSNTGCAECSQCMKRLQHSIVDAANNTNVTEEKFQVLQEFSKFNAPLMETASLMEQAEKERQHLYGRIAAGNEAYHEHVTLRIPQINTSLQDTYTRAQYLSNLSKDAASNFTVHLEEVRNTKNKTSWVQQYLNSVDDVIEDIRTALIEYDVIASEALVDSMKAFNSTRERNFTQHLDNIAENIQMTENVTFQTEETLRRVFSQLTLARELEDTVKEKKENFTRIQEFYNQSHDQFMGDIEKVYSHSREVEETLMETKDIFEQELLTLNRTLALLEDTNITLTNTQILLTEGESLLEDLFQMYNGNFVPSCSLTNVSDLLGKEFRKIKVSLENATVNLRRAQTHAFHLESLAQQIEETFNHSHPHGSRALLAIDEYLGIHEMINKTLKLVQQANNTLNNITKEFSVFSSADFQRRAEMIFEGYHDLYNGTMRRNLSIHRLERAVYDANETFQDSVTAWNKVYEEFPSLQNYTGRYTAAAADAPEVLSSLSDAQNQVTNTSVLLGSLETHLSQMERVVLELLHKTSIIRNTSKEGITLMNESFVNVLNVTKQLSPSPTEPAVNATVREAKAVMDSLPSFRNQTEIKINSVSSKLQSIKHLVASIPFALHIENDSSIMLVPSKSTIENPHTSEISVDIKTYRSEGTFLYMIGDPNNLTARSDDEMTNTLWLFVSNSSVHLVLNLGHGPITAHNPLELKNDTWYNIYATRFGGVVSLTVSSDINERETVTTNGSSDSGENVLQLTTQSSIYLGGLPSNLTESQELNYFNGIIDNFVMDKTRYNLWDSEETHGSGVLYAAPRYKRPFYPTNGKTVSFFGNGYLQHALGQFNGSLGFTAVELDFRTLHQNGIIMAISGDQGRYHFVIYIQNGQVNFYFEPDQDDGIILKSTGSSYANGRWYHIRAVRTRTNATLSVKPAGSSETPDNRFVGTGMTLMAKDHVITFGALNPESITSFEVTDVFSGDMVNLLLFSATSGTLMPRVFSDPELLIGKQGVSFSGIIKGPIEYGTRFYGYEIASGECSYASINVDREDKALSSVTFIFKTEAESGVLLYIGNDETPSLYIALLHGDLFLWLGDVKSSPVFTSSNGTFADNSWYALRFTSTADRYDLFVNDTLTHSGRFDFAGSPILVHKQFYVGGIPLNKSSQVPYSFCFRGGMKDLLINSRFVSLLSEHALGVSNAGVIPARVPPPIPKTCVPPLASASSMNNPRTVHFDLFESKGESYIGFNLNGSRSDIFQSAFVVALDFRALSDDGILLYATDHDTHPTQFFSLELVRGRLVFKFNSGRGLVSTGTANTYTGKGVWYRVYILRFLHFGAMLVNTREYSNNRHNPPSKLMHLRKLYIGGIPKHVVATHLTNRHLGFAGCISDFTEENNKWMFDLTKADLVGPEKIRRSCYTEVQSGLGFNGSSWARFDNLTLAANFSVQLTFRTSSRNGIIFLIMGQAVDDSDERMYVSLKQARGQIIFTYSLKKNRSQVVWTEPGLENNSTSSYLLCQMEWHSVVVTKQGQNVTMVLDKHPAISGPVTNDAHINGQLFLGGYPAYNTLEPQEDSTGLKGCLKSFTLDGHPLHFASAIESLHVITACPLSSSERNQ
ncbi:laminin subunit alpha-like isoform X2 [Montipora capricornis]